MPPSYTQLDVRNTALCCLSTAHTFWGRDERLEIDLRCMAFIGTNTALHHLVQDLMDSRINEQKTLKLNFYEVFQLRMASYQGDCGCIKQLAAIYTS
jgi:hypothetical protein